MNQLHKLLDKPVRLYVIATGAGAGIQQALWSVPGCSSFFVGASFPYEGSQTEELLGFAPNSFCSAETALDLAMAAYMKACNGDPHRKPVGLGLTASVATLKPHRGEHRVYAAVVTPDGAWASEVILPKENGLGNRERDGRLADTLGLELLLNACGLLDPEKNIMERFADPAFKNGGIEGTYKFSQDVTSQGRKRFFDHPVFNRGHRYKTCPEGRLTLFPGAFNPPHEGHFTNADNAGEDTIFHITVNPPHKEPLNLGDILLRASYFKEYQVIFTQDDPLYIDKAKRFPGSTFVIGVDALERMLDPKWGHEIEPMLEEFDFLKTHFKVAGRLGMPSMKEVLEQRMLKEDLSARIKRAMILYLFSELPTSSYAGLSSTEIRAERARKAS